MDEYEPSEEPQNEFMSVQCDERFTRSRQPSVRIDWDAVDHERMIRMKRERASAKRALTNAVKEVTAALVCHGSEDRESLAHLEEKLDAVFIAFLKACNSFKAIMDDEDDIDECCAYFSEGEGRFLSTMQRLRNVGDSEIQDIQPHDSVSQISHSKRSNVSKYSKSSSISSVKSALGKKMLQNATRKANLIAEESLLARRQSLAYQEIKLNQLREEFQLHEELTKLEAEEKVMDEIFKTDGHITPSNFNTDHNVSLLVKSANRLRLVARSSPPDSVVSDIINQSIRSVARSSFPVSVVSDVINQSMRSVARSSSPVSVVSDVINQSMRSVARSSSPVSVVSGVINQSMRSVARSSSQIQLSVMSSINQ
eukprot:Seg1433.6 transcript_id=Seg1433.6/GoldUCD/mRNA.D3Y31 product="hypothetical protein" protein_id=Seg1433.6/GoldUCD/D3Y31